MKILMTENQCFSSLNKILSFVEELLSEILNLEVLIKFIIDGKRSLGPQRISVTE